MRNSAIIAELLDRVLKPLVLGGAVRPLDPIGAAQASTLAQQAALSISSADTSWVNVARVRSVRELCPVDTLAALSVSEWMMIVALNDLIRSTDPEIESFLTSGRAARVVDGAIETLAQVPGARTLGEALARHATFRELMSLRRTDTTVSWWCGSKAFVGRNPPDRLMSWPRVRRVRSQREELELTTMVTGSEATKAKYLEAIRALLARTPLTDLATAGRSAPTFVWSSPTVSLLSGSSGRNLALRALRLDSSHSPTAVLTAVRNAAQTMAPTSSPNLQRAVNSVSQDLEAWPNVA